MPESKPTKTKPEQPFVSEAAEVDATRTTEENSRLEREEAEAADQRGAMDRVHAPAR